ncbi:MULTISPECIES: HK97 family phage prohead protease [Clostridium]|uniref:Phage prohead protein n=1 Tax=Clostridium botulinum B2 450 TaxID=1379739 RepID=A0A0D1C1F0_CLOBO|nr:HK97 family phage prohead protease [Clostridium botulinum]KIS24886.1 phage prohead protein [Clostridium botulinum B2 450]MDU5116542.1 HK97 family phage prohead protease [Clostridium botulinum]
MNKKKELRSIEKFEIREVEENDNTIELEGYIAKFDTYTELWNKYYEKIDRNAFDETLSDGHNIFLVYHHDMSKVLSSTRNNTLILTTDDIGLKFKAIINKKLTYANDVYELVKTGECRGCSFGFYILEEDTNYNSEKDEVRSTLLKVELLEGTITPIPAYEDTEVSARNKKERMKTKGKPSDENEIEKLRTKISININK